MKSVSHISQRIICPKCGTRNLRKSIPAKAGAEYFCDKDHSYFGIVELVNQWNYDAGDFYGEDGQTQLTFAETGLMHFWLKKSREDEFEKLKEAVLYFSTKLAEGEVLSPVDQEGEWSSNIARNESYDVVNRMLMGIEELEWNFDIRDLPYPIGA